MANTFNADAKVWKCDSTGVLTEEPATISWMIYENSAFTTAVVANTDDEEITRMRLGADGLPMPAVLMAPSGIYSTKGLKIASIGGGTLWIGLR